MKIQLKRSNQLDGGSAKEPSIDYMEYGELAVNFNEADPCIFIKASDGAGNDSIVRIAGAGAESGGLPNGGTDERPDTPSIGDLFFDTDLNLIVYWDGSEWVPVLDKDTTDSYYVEKAGDNMTGNLTLGTDKITLDATDGGAEFAAGDASIEGNGSANFNGDGLFNKIEGNYRNRLYGGGLISSFNSFDRDSIGMYLDIGDAGSANPPELNLTANSGAAGDALLVQRQGQTTPDVKLKYDGSGEFRGNITAGNVIFNLETDNDANYVSTTDSEGNETRVYNGPTLDVKDRLQNALSRIDAIEANEVVDDATDSALLQLVASLSARLDEKDEAIASLTDAFNALIERVTTLES